MLSEVTETLAGELVRPTVRSPDWSEVHWLLARAVSAIHGISGLLASRPWPDGPRTWSSFLLEQRDHIATRHRRMEDALGQIDSAARTEGIAVLGLKGSALRKMSVYDAGQRPMADIDLLAHSDELPRATRLLESLAFHETQVIARHRAFEPKTPHAPAALGEFSANDVKIDLHTRIMEQLPLRQVDITESVFPSHQPAGLCPYPSTAALMLHLILHSAGNMVIRTLRLVQLHDIARVTARMSEVDWENVVRLACANEGNGWWLYPPLALMRRYVGIAAPEAVLEHARSRCPRRLVAVCRERSLAGFSLSHPWVAAFPALCWTRSGPERLTYLCTRLLRSDIAVYRKTAFRQKPTLAAGKWSRLSRARKLIRWATGRAPRLGTLAAIEAAFAARN